MSMSANHEVVYNGEAPPHPVWPRRLAIILLGALLGTVMVGAVVSSFVQGSWWYPHIADRALDAEHRASLAAIRDELAASGQAPRAVTYLEAALVPNIAPTTMWNHLVEARDALEDVDDAGLERALEEIETSIALIRSRGYGTQATPYPLPTLAPSE